MSEITLSKDADYLICVIYKYYLELHDNGISKSEAKNFENIEIVHSLVPDWSLDDINDTCLELSNNGLLIKQKKYISEHYDRFSLSDVGIVYMENRFSNKLNKLIDYISKLKP